MTLKGIGEAGIVERVRRLNRPGRGVKVGIGDDAAVLEGSRDDVILTTDMLVEDVHFRLSHASSEEVGRKAMAVNLSDIAAMGGVPTWAVVSVGLPENVDEAFVDGLLRGLERTARRYGARIVGGDTNRSSKLVVCVTLLGRPAGPRVFTRAGARPGDVVFVTGFLGGTYRSGKHLNFKPRLAEAAFLARGGYKVGAMMDLSDGLAADLPRLARESRVGAVVQYEAVPISPDARDMEDALGGGEDFELLFTLPPAEAARLTLTEPRGLGPFHPVGKIFPKSRGVLLLMPDGKLKPLRGGFDHFPRT